MNDTSVGALWRNQYDGDEYFTFKLDKNKIPPDHDGKFIAFQNKFKVEGSNQPDLKIYLSKPKEKRETEEPF